MKWLTIALAAILIGATAAALTQKYFTNLGTIQTIGNFDYYLEGWPNNETLNWGNMTPGDTYLVNLTITNNYNVPATIYITTAGTLPGTLSWALNNTVWTVGETKGADMVLSIPANATAGDYTWTTTITAEE